MDFEELKRKIEKLYMSFFKDMNIDFQTGIVKGTNKRFSGYPYIGKKLCLGSGKNSVYLIGLWKGRMHKRKHLPLICE